LEKFKDFCRVDVNLDERTVEGYYYSARKFLGWVQMRGYETVNTDVVREYLQTYLEKSKCTRANQIKAFRRFFRDYLGVPDVVASFKLPRIRRGEIGRYMELPFTKVDLQHIYQALEHTKYALRNQALFLLYATSGLRLKEALRLTPNHINRDLRSVILCLERGTKKTGITFYNEEAEQALNAYLREQPSLSPNDRFFSVGGKGINWVLVRTSKQCGLKRSITPQMLRVWFSFEMGRLGVPDRYIDIFQGRAPRSVLAEFYTPKGIQELKQIYDKAELRVLS